MPTAATSVASTAVCSSGSSAPASAAASRLRTSGRAFSTRDGDEAETRRLLVSDGAGFLPDHPAHDQLGQEPVAQPGPQPLQPRLGAVRGIGPEPVQHRVGHGRTGR